MHSFSMITFYHPAFFYDEIMLYFFLLKNICYTQHHIFSKLLMRSWKIFIPRWFKSSLFLPKFSFCRVADVSSWSPKQKNDHSYQYYFPILNTYIFEFSSYKKMLKKVAKFSFSFKIYILKMIIFDRVIT